MKKAYLIGGSITVLAAAILAGCNKNDHDQPYNSSLNAPATTQVTITPSLGKIINAKVILRNAKTGVILGTGNTGNTGVAKFTAKVTTSPVVVEVQGTDGAQGATYFDEAANADKPLPSTQKIRAIAPSLNAATNIGVSVLTDLAYQSAVKATGAETNITTADVVNQANTQIKNLLAKELDTASILTPPTLIDKTTVVKTAITTRSAANNYALKLAALARLGSGDTPVLDLLQKLSDDISDGKLDEKKGAAFIGYNHDTTNFVVALNNSLANYVEQVQLNMLYTASILNGFQVTSGDIKINVTVGGGGTGTGCVATVSFGGATISKICYKGFPQGDICGAGNAAIAANAGQFASVGANISFAPGGCEGATVTVDYGTLGVK